MSHDTYPYLVPGDIVTFDLVNGAGGITGEVVSADLAADGTLRCLTVRDDPARPDPLHIHGAAIAIWRRGVPVRQTVPRQIAVPAGSLPGLLGQGPNHRQ